MMQALKDDLHEFLIDDDRFVRTAFTKFQIFLGTQWHPRNKEAILKKKLEYYQRNKERLKKARMERYEKQKAANKTDTWWL